MSKAQFNRNKLDNLLQGTYSAANFYRTHNVGTASGKLTRDIYIGTLRAIQWDIEYVPTSAEFSVSSDPANSPAYSVQGWIYRNSSDHWTALVEYDDGVETLGYGYKTASAAIRAITGR